MCSEVSTDRKNYNYGLALLRIWMCFEVVFFHFFVWKQKGGPLTEGLIYCLNYYKDLAVPVFMLLAFIFTDVEQLAFNKEKRKKRFRRLIEPTVFWAMVYYLILRLFDTMYSTDNIKAPTDFVWQLLTGHVYNKTLWFQSLLIYLTVLFTLIFYYLGKKKGLWASIFIGIIAIAFQYSGINIYIVNSIEWPKEVLGQYFDSTYIINPLGRLMEMIPYASIGIVIKKTKLLEHTQKRRRLYASISALVLLIGLVVGPVHFIDGFYYQGWSCNI